MKSTKNPKIPKMKQRFISFLENQSRMMLFKKKSVLPILPISDAPEVRAEVDPDAEDITEDEEERDVQLIPRRRRITPAFDTIKAEKAKGKNPLVFDVVTDQARTRQGASSTPAMSNLIKKALLNLEMIGEVGPPSSSSASKLKAPPVTAPVTPPQQLPSSSEEPLTTALSSEGSAKKAAVKDLFAPVVTEPDSPSVSDDSSASGGGGRGRGGDCYGVLNRREVFVYSMHNVNLNINQNTLGAPAAPYPVSSAAGADDWLGTTIQAVHWLATHRNMAWPAFIVVLGVVLYYAYVLFRFVAKFDEKK